MSHQNSLTPDSKKNSLKKIENLSQYQKGDVLVIFGEVFQRGYVNGLIEAAQARGLKVIYSCLGRRDENLNLRPLTPEELLEKDQSPLINIPLEAGFDIHPNAQGERPIDALANVKLSDWESAHLNWSLIEDCKKMAAADFESRLKRYVNELEPHIPEDANVIFAHIMAGGFPRAKVVMPAANRVFKGYEARYYSSEKFWETDIGKLCAISFEEVTGETFKKLIEATTPLREKKKKSYKKVSYIAYGYHGSEVFVRDHFQWQAYSPYLQGWAKLHLESISQNYFNQGLSTCVFNAPEILTNSSSIFLGVEVCLYPLMKVLQLTHPRGENTISLLNQAQNLLKDGVKLDTLFEITNQYFENEVIQKWSQYDLWPQHNGPEQMKLMRETSLELINLHKDPKNLITSLLSEVVFKGCGEFMLHESWSPKKPVQWIGHEGIAQEYESLPQFQK